VNTENITISFLGVDERSKSAYQLFFENITPVQYELIDDYKKAQLCLIDKDSNNVQQQYTEITLNHPEKYILSLSIIEQDCQHEKEFFLQKPLNRQALQDILNKISGYISGKTIIKSQIPSHSQIKNTVKKISQKYIKKQLPEVLDTPAASTTKIRKRAVTLIYKTSNVFTSNTAQPLKVNNEEYIVGRHSNIDAKKSEQLQSILYSPKKFLQAAMEQACEKSKTNGGITELRILDHVFYFDSAEQKIYSTAGTSVLRNLCVVQLQEQPVFSLKPESFREDLNYIIQTNTNKSPTYYSWNMEAFVWVITLWCSRGRVPEGTDLSMPVYLMQWPNLTRLEHIPHATRIAALLYDQPRSLVDTAMQLKIKQRYVFAFYSACKAIGLSGISIREVDRLFEPEKLKHTKSKSILSKLLRKISDKTDDSNANTDRAQN